MAEHASVELPGLGLHKDLTWIREGNPARNPSAASTGIEGRSIVHRKAATETSTRKGDA